MKWHKQTVAAIALAVLATGCSGSGGGNVPFGGGPTTGGTSNTPAASPLFRQGTSADKAQNRPSLAKPGTIVRDHHHHDQDFRLLSFLNANVEDNSGGLTRLTVGPGSGPGYIFFTEPNSTCDDGLFDAPWYFAQGDFTLKQLPSANNVTVCSTSHHGDVATPPVPATGNLYIVMIDIGWFDLDAQVIAGPASSGSGPLNFTPTVDPLQFQNDHLYVFFAAQLDLENEDH